MSQSERDQDAAAAVIGHHTHLAAELAHHTTRLRDAAAESRDESGWQHYRDHLGAWLREELLPHAQAEEGALYPAAAAQPGGQLLVDGMLAEHRAIIALASDLAAAGTPVDAAAAARALSALFETHLAKENELILPLLLGSEEVSVAGLLAGMHDLLGAAETGGGSGGGGSGGGSGGRSGGGASGASGSSGSSASASGGSGSGSASSSGSDGCGCGGCACGGDQSRTDAPAPMVDEHPDVPGLPHEQRVKV